MKRGFTSLAKEKAIGLGARLALVALASAIVQARPFRVTDAIEMRHIAPYTSPLWSPDGRTLLVQLRQGSLRENLTYDSLLLFEASVPRPGGRELIKLGSNCNQESLSQVRWRGSQQISFLSREANRPGQVCLLDISTGQRRTLLARDGSILRYSLADSSDLLCCATPGPLRGLDNANTRQHGLVVGDISLKRLLQDTPGDDQENCDLLVNGKALNIPDHFKYDATCQVLEVSPDGHQLAFTLRLESCPPGWNAYTHPYLRESLAQTPAPGQAYYIFQLFVLNLDSGQIQPILDAPFHPAGTCHWSPDSRSLLVCSSFAPLASDAHNQLQTLRVWSGPRLGFEILAPKPLHFEGWDERGLRLSERGKITLWEFAQDRWSTRPEDERHRPASFRLEEGPNRPTQLWIGKEKVLDLDDFSQDIQFAEVREIEVPLGDGRQLRAGLFLPPQAKSGQPLPLVIQTHGWDSSKFWPDGNYPATTACAAQALASHGIMVAQIDVAPGAERPEMEARVEEIDALIDYLAECGQIDPNRVGLMGWSRTCLQVKAALTRSRNKLAAALVAEGVDGGYWQYLGYRNEIQGWYELLNGGKPFGAGMQSWIETAPGFRLDRVECPLLIQVSDRQNILPEWEWYSGLRSLQKPVDFVAILGGSHNLFQPQQRKISQELAFDWFRFWLCGETSQEPHKQAQFTRWTALQAGSR